MTPGNNNKTTNGKRILIVDDDRFITRVLRMKLEQEGFQVFVAHNGSEGFEHVMKHKPQVVVTDLNMPIMNGWELCTQINQTPNTNPYIIITTSLIDHRERERVKEFSNAQLVDKPVSPKEICNLIHELFNSSTREGEQK
jgi:DNA-binding response OmpR family regulator